MKFWGTIIALAFLLHGVTSLTTYFNNRTQGVYSFEEYISNKPDEQWVKLTGCKLDISEATYFSILGSNPSKIYVPIKTQSGIDSTSDVALLCITDDKTLGAFNKLNGFEDPMEMFKYYNDNKSIFYQENRTIEGLERNWMDMDEDEVSELQELNPNLTSKFVIIEEGKNPSISGIVGIPVFIGIIWFLFFRSKKEEQVA